MNLHPSIRQPPHRALRLTLAMAAATAYVALIGLLGDDHPRPSVTVTPGPVVMRVGDGVISAYLNDAVTALARPGDEIRAYRAERMVMRCSLVTASVSVQVAPAACYHGLHGPRARLTLALPSTYRVVVLRSWTVSAGGMLDHDLAAARSAGAVVLEREIVVR